MAKTTAKKSTKPAGVKAAAGLLPPPKDLERICKGIATLDAIVCDDWEMRYYSFQQAWDATSGQRMASMRNGSPPASG